MDFSPPHFLRDSLHKTVLNDDAKLVMSRLVKLKDADRSFDIEFWQRLGPEAIFKAAWELAEHAYAGKNVDLRLQRTVASFRKLGD